MREYTKLQTIVANLPYVAMILLGTATIAFGFASSPWAWLGAVSYFVYGVIGPLWIMIFVCPYCAYYATKGCPCGYGTISARVAPKGERDCFSTKFKRHIPVIVPLWLIPAACGATALWLSFSWQLAALALAFAVNSYVILPLVSKRHSCGDCPQKADCPWMAKGR